MKINSRKTVKGLTISLFLGAAMLLATPSSRGAMALIYELDRRYSGVNVLPASTIWATATFHQLSSTSVGLHMKANSISSGYVANWWFNFTGLPSDLSVFATTQTSGTSSPTFAYNGLNTTLFDSGRSSLNWDFSLYSAASPDFQNGDEIFVTFYSASALPVSAFDSSTPGNTSNPNLFSGANINGLPIPGGGNSGVQKIVDIAPRYEDVQPPPNFVLVPEASSVFLGFLLLAGCVGGELFRRNREPALAPVRAS